MRELLLFLHKKNFKLRKIKKKILGKPSISETYHLVSVNYERPQMEINYQFLTKVWARSKLK